MFRQLIGRVLTWHHRGGLSAFTRHDPENFLINLQAHPVRQFIFDEIKSEFAQEPFSAILEVGFGGCHDYLKMRGFFQQNDIQYTGVDFSPRFVEYAQCHYPEAMWARGDVRHLDMFEVGAFDVIYLYHVLEHLEKGYSDVIKAIQELCRVAKRSIFIIWFRAPTFMAETSGRWDKDTQVWIYKYSARDIWKAVLTTDFMVRYIRWDNPWQSTVWKLERKKEPWPTT